MVITDVKICDINGERVVNVTVEEGVITKIEEIKEPSDTPLCLIPSLIDLNVRVKDDILNSKKIEDLSCNASKGGVKDVILNPESTPAIDDEIVLEFVQNNPIPRDGANIHCSFNTIKSSDATLSNIAILLKKGAVAPFMSTTTHNNLAIKIAEYVKMYGVTLFCRAEDRSLRSMGVMNEGETSSCLGLAGIPAIGELLHVSRMIELARYYGIKVLFKSIANPRSIEMISKAKKEGVDVRCEVSIHHLLHSDKLCENFNTAAKIYPPLATQNDMQLMQEALKNGEVDLLTVLHHPSSPLNKEVAFFDAAYGCESIDHALPLYYTKLVKSEMVSMKDLIRLCVQNPAKAIGEERGKIEVGTKGFVIFDTKETMFVDNSQSLYNGEELFGVIKEPDEL
ncbi:dihydroorotase [Sulfurimonas sp. HSL-1716]|uniref:dihydroorotase n=1 Tax=Hydrocurvibacter sulfurireducens TaxID=3131937 RepID=UPI0031F89DCA